MLACPMHPRYLFQTSPDSSVPSRVEGRLPPPIPLTPLLCYSCALFCATVFYNCFRFNCFRTLSRKPPGVGTPQRICPLFSITSALFKIQLAPSLPAVAALPGVVQGKLRRRVVPSSSRCSPVRAPLFSHGKRSLSLFPSCRCRTFSFNTRGGTPPPFP